MSQVSALQGQPQEQQHLPRMGEQQLWQWRLEQQQLNMADKQRQRQQQQQKQQQQPLSDQFLASLLLPDPAEGLPLPATDPAKLQLHVSLPSALSDATHAAMEPCARQSSFEGMLLPPLSPSNSDDLHMGISAGLGVRDGFDVNDPQALLVHHQYGEHLDHNLMLR